MTFPILFLLFLISPFVVTAFTPNSGLSCADHPAKDAPSTSSVLFQSFNFIETKFASTSRLAYLAREATVKFVPVSQPTSEIYFGLDLFYFAPGAAGKSSSNPDALVLYLQRPGKVYIFVSTSSIRTNNDNPIKFPGWKSAGFAENLKPDVEVSYGVYRTSKLPISRYAYVFEKDTMGPKNMVTLPHSGAILKANSGLRSKGNYVVRIAEANGSPVKPPPKFRGITVLPNVKCPEIVHDAWGTYDDTGKNIPQDPTTNGVLFGSWHPHWDPCFWW